MNHLNIFNPYKNKSNNHEDELTRAFLILVKNIPLVQILLYEMVRNELGDIGLPSVALGDLSVDQVYTQVSNTNSLFDYEVNEGSTLISIVISDDRFETDVVIKNDDRKAIYDGVIICNPSWIFIIENKPSKDNIWTRQLNPNISKDKDINIIEKPCSLSWRGIIEKLNNLIQNKMVDGFELRAIEDFVEYIDNEFPWLNPYTSFGACKGNKYLLDKRCVSVLSNCKINGETTEVKYHKGWKYYIDSGVKTIKQIALDSNKDGEKFTIDLLLYAGDIMSGAKQTFANLNIDALLQLEKQGFKLFKNFHVSFSNTNLLYFDGILDLEEYVRFWGKEYINLYQIKRSAFKEYFTYLEKQGMIKKDDWKAINEEIMNKGYNSLNVCPGIGIQYSWKEEEAISLDKINGFDDDFCQKLNLVFSTIDENIHIEKRG